MKRFGNFVFYKLFPLLIVIAGILIAAYPWISDYMYRDRVSGIRTEYENTVADTGDELEIIKEKIQQYNQDLLTNVIALRDPFNEDVSPFMTQDYNDLFAFKNNLIGFIEIPNISVNLPIYAGVSATILEAGIGHLEQTSIPIGGKNTHSVLTGHTGLRDKKLFTDLDKMDIGDLFFLDVLGEKLCYKVFEINVVDPDDCERLYIQDGKDLCTLVTCTPYGINSHRLLVTGERTEYTDGMENEIEAEDYISDWRLEYLFCIFIGLVLVFTFYFTIKLIKKRRFKVKNNEEKKTD